MDLTLWDQVNCICANWYDNDLSCRFKIQRDTFDAERILIQIDWEISQILKKGELELLEDYSKSLVVPKSDIDAINSFENKMAVGFLTAYREYYC